MHKGFQILLIGHTGFYNNHATFQNEKKTTENRLYNFSQVRVKVTITITYDLMISKRTFMNIPVIMNRFCFIITIMNTQTNRNESKLLLK